MPHGIATLCHSLHNDSPMLTNKVTIVTGSTSGIGQAIAQALSDAGAKVMINSAHSAEKGRRFAESLPDAAYFQADIQHQDQCQQLIKHTIEKWGQLDILVNNAGISKRIAHNDLNANDDATFQAMWDVNFMGTWYLCRAAMEHLQKSNPGHIINISSIAGTRATGSSIPYAVSKAAVNHLTKLLANQFSEHVRINAIAPGLINTPRTESWQDVQEYFTTRTASKKAGSPKDIAELALGILRSDYITGQVIECDGGFCLG